MTEPTAPVSPAVIGGQRSGDLPLARPSSELIAAEARMLEAERLQQQYELELIRGAAPKDHTQLYLGGVFVSAALLIVFVLAITAISKERDPTPLIATVSAVLGGIITGLLGLLARDFRRAIDGKDRESLIHQRASARLQGRLDKRTPLPGQVTELEKLRKQVEELRQQLGQDTAPADNH